MHVIVRHTDSATGFITQTLLLPRQGKHWASKRGGTSGQRSLHMRDRKRKGQPQTGTDMLVCRFKEIVCCWQAALVAELNTNKKQSELDGTYLVISSVELESCWSESINQMIFKTPKSSCRLLRQKKIKTCSTMCSKCRYGVKQMSKVLCNDSIQEWERKGVRCTTSLLG